jgi:two-component system autoinducer 2 sensor kinase/phosphatase LuxQ
VTIIAFNTMLSSVLEDNGIVEGKCVSYEQFYDVLHSINNSLFYFIIIGIFFISCAVFYLRSLLSKQIESVINYSRSFLKGNSPSRLNSSDYCLAMNELIRAISMLNDKYQTASQKLTKSYHREEKAIREASDANERLNLFLTNITADLKNPLNPILGFSKILQSKIKENDSSAEMLTQVNIVYDSASYLDKLISNLIELSRIKSSTINITSAEFNITEFITELLAMTKGDADQNGININSEISSDVPYIIHTDKSLLSFLLTNLINAVVKNSFYGESVTLGIKSTREHIVFYLKDISAKIEGKALAEYFNDEIAEEKDLLNNINKGASVVNLTVIKAHSEILNADLEVFEEEGKSVFNIIFDKELIIPEDVAQVSSNIYEIDNEEEQQINNDIIRWKPDNIIKILMLEENEANRMLIENYLSDFNSEVEYVNDEVSCTEVLSRVTFDLIFLDNRPSRVDMDELITNIRENTVNSLTPIIIMSAYFGGDIKQGLLFGAEDIILKPINEEELKQKIFSWYNIKKEREYLTENEDIVR